MISLNQSRLCMPQAVEQRNPTWIIFSGPQKAFSIFFHKFDIYLIVLLRYFYNISNKPVTIINTSNIHSWHKVSNIRRCLDFWNGDIWCTLSAEMNLISMPLAVVIKWWWILEPRKLPTDKYLSYRKKFVIWFWTPLVLILMKIISGILLTHKSYIKLTFKMWLFWKLDWVTKCLNVPPIPPQGLFP